MIATFFLETAMAIYLIGRYVLTPTLRIIISILILLAVFQLSEFGICESYALGGTEWAKLGFSAITLLPPLGLHLVSALRQNPLSTKAKLFIYAPAALWIFTFVFGHVMLSQGCTGNYIVFQIKRPYDLMYYLWYDALLVIAIAKAWLQTRNLTNKRIVSAHWALIIGYLTFIVPSIAVRVLFEFSDKTASALPSIMCGFAVIFAGFLTFRVAPNITTQASK